MRLIIKKEGSIHEDPAATSVLKALADKEKKTHESMYRDDSQRGTEGDR